MSDVDARLREFAEDVAYQFGYWVAGKTGGLTAGGLSTLEEAFAILGWEDPHPVPDRRCDEPGCMEDGTMGWPTRPGGTGLNGGYRRTCFAHSAFGRARAAAAIQPGWVCDWKPDDLNPGPECPYCAGMMCARFDGLNCTHNIVERHSANASVLV